MKESLSPRNGGINIGFTDPKLIDVPLEDKREDKNAGKKEIDE